MKTMKLKNFLTNRLAWIFFSFHFVLFGFGLFLRGGFRSIHFYYEPVVLKVLLTLDLIWMAISDGIFAYGMGSDDRVPLIFIWFTAGIQWFLLGYLLDLRLKSKRSEFPR